MPKIPVSVISLTVADGAEPARIPASRKLAFQYKVIPLRLLTADGKRIIVDYVEDIRREASTKAGGLGDRYTCRVTSGGLQKIIYVYRDENTWYLEEEI